jgi:hypothetical protein
MVNQLIKEELNRIKTLMGLITEEEKNGTFKVVFRTDNGIDLGACIGIAHGGTIDLPEEVIKRINNIDNLHFIAEGAAAKNPELEPGMMKFIDEHFSGYKIEDKSWDEITEEQGLGVGNPKYNINYVFMQHKYNNYIDDYSYSGGTMLDALAKTTRPEFPPNSPTEPEERKKWLKYHMEQSGFLENLEQPYNREKLYDLLTEMEETVYPEGQQVPNKKTYFGVMQQSIEDERNKTIYDLMENGGVSIAGEGHVDELKQQFPDLEFLPQKNEKTDFVGQHK